MNRSWREIAAELAGPDAEIGEGVSSEWDGMVVAELTIPGARFRIPGSDSADAWGRLAASLGDMRLVQSLEGAGWEVIEEVIDETTYVVARDPAGMTWAIGVASTDGGRRGYLERDIGLDDRAFDRIVFVEPLDTRSPDALLAALAEES